MMSGKMSSIHYDWLQLIEVSGPFLSTTVLNEAFPDGLDGLDKRVKRDLSRFYSEWVEACEIQHPKLPELHKAWCEAVLKEGLELELDGGHAGRVTLPGNADMGARSARPSLRRGRCCGCAAT